MHIPRASAARIRAEVEQPLTELRQQLSALQTEIAQVAGSVAGSVNGKWPKAYIDAMKTFASGDGGDAIQGMKNTAAKMSDFAHEAAYQVDYTNRMIIAQVAEFLFEW